MVTLKDPLPPTQTTLAFVESAPIMKRCSKCGEVKGLGEFNRQKDGRSHDRRSHCKSCVKAYQKTYNSDPEHKVRKRVRDKVYKSDTRVKAFITVRNKAYQSTHNLQAYELCGGAFCRVCGHDILADLEIHHGLLDGKERRETLARKLGVRKTRFRQSGYIRALANGHENIDGLVVLCRNCHFKVTVNTLDLQPYVDFTIPPPPMKSKDAPKFRRRYDKLRSSVYAVLGNACDCGESGRGVCAIHHVNKDGKARKAEHGVSGKYLCALRDGRESLDGLVLVCHNHHNAIHRGEIECRPRDPDVPRNYRLFYTATGLPVMPLDSKSLGMEHEWYELMKSG